MENEKIVITGSKLTTEQIAKVAYEGTKIEISEEAWKRVESSRKLVFDLADNNIPIYGFTTGVGWNKDKKVFKEFFSEYNNNLIHCHTLGLLPEASQEEVRAVMLVRLNPLLLGAAGIQPAIVKMYQNMLNFGIHPVVPERGSVGEGDITCLSHIGLAMIGEGEVHYKGKKVPAAQALRESGLKPVTLGPKDGLAIVSSNALSAGEGVLVLKQIKDLIDIADAVYALSLEGFNGNTSPLDSKVHEIRKFPGQAISAKNIREYLRGSYLWDKNRKPKALQDPLSYRGAANIHGSLRDALEYVEKYLLLHINTSDDNPCVITKERRIVSCSNFEVITWVAGFEMLGIILSHVSKISCYRTIKLSTPSFTDLPRFLSPADDVICYGTIQKVFTSLDSEIRHLSNNASSDYFAVAGEIEDHACNAVYVVQKTRKIVDDLIYILAIEAMHASQAVDLRKNPDLGKGSRAIYEAIRSEIPFYDKDRNISVDIHKAYNIIKSGKMLSMLKKFINK
ncbi:HAL/PAL/TAL family ammonia-lyase [Clostridium ljungdahlii]|uniref:Histidine ammonia-lyase n=1 Tax=Clostridium ljungdahlii TaxID=1538 RepID=A0A162J9E2_9CLOT|nr:aromatic amino acid ammonia-lyase [Clostridium ljungdahlii]OAA92185.1 Histidine ammonia-lyase [Clostridium ljungdahlii]